MASKARNLVVDLAAIIVIVLTFALWIIFFPQQYFLAAILLIIETLAYAIIYLERLKIDAREIALIAALAVLAIVGRALFYAIPQVKPTAAIVLIAGFALGKVPGTIVGILSMFLSNFIFGQSLATPFQMLGMGLVGFIAGFFSGLKAKKKLQLWHELVLGFILVSLGYGFIVDTGTVIFLYQSLGEVAVWGTYVSGFFFNLVHAVATVVFLLFLSPLLSTQLSRLCKKYGLFSLKVIK